MTVAELIAILSRYNPNANVIIESSGTEGEVNDIEVTIPIVTITPRREEVKA